MKIKNSTHWQTRQLKTFLVRVAKDELTPERSKRLTVEIVYNRAGKNAAYVSGCAYVRSHWMRIRIGAHNVDRIDLAKVIAHEMAHTRGMVHSQMKGRPEYTRVKNWREIYAWAEDLPLEKTAPKKKPAADIQVVRYRRVLTNIANWESKFKRAANALKKLKKQKRYYETAIAAKREATL